MNNKITNKENLRGFSLLEFLMYMTILSIVGLIIGGAFLSINQGQGRSSARTEVNSAINFVLRQINQDIKASAVVTVPHQGKITTCDTTTISNCLSLVVGKDTITYNIDVNDRVVRSVNGSASEITPTSVKIDSLSVEKFVNTNMPVNTSFSTYQVVINGSYNSARPDLQYSETRQTTLAPVLVYANSIRGTVVNAGGTTGSCLELPLVGPLC